MTDFEKEFPSLKNAVFTIPDDEWDGEYPQYIDVILTDDIKNDCLDKHRVRKAWKKLKQKLNNNTLYGGDIIVFEKSLGLDKEEKQ